MEMSEKGKLKQEEKEEVESDEEEVEQEEQGWEDWDEEESEGETKCLICSQSFDNPQAALLHCTMDHGFDLSKFVQSNALDFYQSIKLVNYIRSQFTEKPLNPQDRYTLGDVKVFQDDQYLQPVIPDDPLLLVVGEFGGEGQEKPVEVPSGSQEIEDSKLRLQIEQLQQKLQQTEIAFRNYVALAEASFLPNGVDLSEVRSDSTKIKDDNDDDEMDYYFKSYSHYSIHESMLKDEIRTNAYRDFILNNEELFKDRVVLDVGCGTSILSMFAAQAGAKHVIGIDASQMAEKAKEIVKLNGFQDVITIIKGKMEEVTLPVEKVDIIISEWMGYFLLFESMLDSVLWARDKYLSPGGRVYPARALMYLCTAEDSEFSKEKQSFWSNVYGFDMSPMRPSVVSEGFVKDVDPRVIGSNPQLIKDIDVEKVTVSELDFISEFRLPAIRDHTCNSFVGFFDVTFDEKAKFPITMSTSPATPETHWKQCLFFLQNPIELKKGDVVSGTISVKKNSKNPRCIDVIITFQKGSEPAVTQSFEL